MIQVDLTHMRHFIALPYEAALAPRLRIAHNHLQKSDGPGGEFTGWVRLPQEYDREEFARIQAAKQRFDTGEQLTRVERFRYVIVGTHFEADDAVDVFPLAGYEDDADIGCCPNGAQQ